MPEQHTIINKKWKLPRAFFREPVDRHKKDQNVKSELIQMGGAGSVSDLLVFISGLARFNEVKPLNVRLRILGVIKNVFL